MVGKIIVRKILWRWESRYWRVSAFIFMKRMFSVQGTLQCVRVLKIAHSHQQVCSLVLYQNQKYKKVIICLIGSLTFWTKQKKNWKVTLHCLTLAWQAPIAAQTANLKLASSLNNSDRSSQQLYVTIKKINKE